MRAFIVAIAFVALANRVVAAQSTPPGIAGIVRDIAGQPLADVQVWIVGTRLMAKTDTLGRYQLDSLAPGPVSLRTAILGYVSTQQSATLIAGEKALLDFRVFPSPLPDGGNVVRTVPLEKPDSQ